eukprot:6085331-Pleurochrysis_carterae.AAC.1
MNPIAGDRPRMRARPASDWSMTPDSLSPPAMTSRAFSRIRWSSSPRPATWPTTSRYSITRLTWRMRMSSSSLM